MARRAAVSPASVGLSPGSRRRTPGLRREELAAIAGVGVTWYTWLEQGRDIGVSAETLNRIATALHLTPTDTTHLFFLAGVGRHERPSRGEVLDLDAGIRGILNAFHAPAFVTGPRWDVEAFNEIADRVYGFDDYRHAFGRNHVWRFFMDDKRRTLYLDWDALAESVVGLLRTSYARLAGDDNLEALVQALAAGSVRFRELWSAQRTAPLTPDNTRLLIPGIGEVVITSVRLPLPGREGFVLFLLPPANERSAERMAHLAAHAADAPVERRRPTSRRRRRRH